MSSIRNSIRHVKGKPGASAVIIITLALGIGANTAIFSVLERFVLNPFPSRESDRLVVAYHVNPRGQGVALSYLDFQDWQSSTGSFQKMTAFNWNEFNLTSPGTPEHLDGKWISSGFFETLGVRLSLGRDFSYDEDRTGGNLVVIISNRLWKDRFAGNPNVLGMSLALDRVPYTIVGVVPREFSLFGDADIYAPLGQRDPILMKDRTVRMVRCIARLKPGLSISQARADLSLVQSRLAELYPYAENGMKVKIAPLKQELVRGVDEILMLLFGAAGVILLIACANIASFVLARSAARTRTFAVCSALGATRVNIIRQLLIESILLSMMGGCLGLAAAKWGMLPILAAVPGSLPGVEQIDLNVRVLLFNFVAAVIVGILFGLFPALRISKADLSSIMKERSRGSVRDQQRVQRTLVIVQVALTLILLWSSGILLRTVRNMWKTDPGFETKNLINFKVGLSPSVTKTGSETRTAFRRLIDSIREVPGVESADLTTLVPLNGSDNSVPFWVGGAQPVSQEDAPLALMYETGPDYLTTMGIRLLQGRFLSWQDTLESTPVVVIDSLLARTYFPKGDAIGQTITFARAGSWKIVGVVDHIRHWGLGNPIPYTQYQTYISFYQIPDLWMPVMQRMMSILVRTKTDSASAIPGIKNAVYRSGSDQPVYQIKSMEQIIAGSMAGQRFPMMLLGTFAGLAIILASVGIYGVITYFTIRREHEIGIRIALGSPRSGVLRMIVGQGLRMVVAGLALGIAVSLFLSRMLSKFSYLLYGIKANDPITFIAVSVVLIGVTLLACLIPAFRAVRVDPMTVLRSQ